MRKWWMSLKIGQNSLPIYHYRKRTANSAEDSSNFWLHLVEGAKMVAVLNFGPFRWIKAAISELPTDQGAGKLSHCQKSAIIFATQAVQNRSCQSEPESIVEVEFSFTAK